MDDTPQPRSAETADRVQVSSRELWEHVFGKPTVWLVTFGFAGMVFCQIGYLTWTPTLLHEKPGLSVTWAGLNALLYHHAGAFLGVVVAGSDRLAQRRPRSRLAFQYVGLLGAAPFIYLMGWADSLVLCCTGLALFGLFRGVYDSHLFAGPFEVAPAPYRSSLLGFILCFGFLGGAFAPVVLAELSKQLGLDQAVGLLSAVHAGQDAWSFWPQLPRSARIIRKPIRWRGSLTMPDLHGKTALVTGAGRGIDAAILIDGGLSLR